MALEVGSVSLPEEYALHRNAILAISGAGKSNTAVVLAEELHRAGIPWFAIDPKGDWHGMRSSSDGTGPGLPIPIFGGEHGDVPLAPESGALIARLIAKDRVTCIIDLSGEEFAVRADMFRFMESFASTLLRLNRTAVHGFLEECDDYLPQNPREGGPAARSLGAWQRLVKRGRQKGIGVTMVSQRAAAVNKDALNMAETLIAMRVQGARDVTAVREWVVGPSPAKPTETEQALLDSLSHLATGDAWVLSPHALQMQDLVKFRLRRTYDSGRTPELGEVLEPPSTLADIDIAGLGAEVAKMAEAAAEDDPDTLRARIAEVEAERDAIAEEARTTHARAGDLTVELDRLRGEYDRLDSEVVALRDRAADVQTVPVEVAVVPAELVDALRSYQEFLLDRAGVLLGQARNAATEFDARVGEVAAEFADENERLAGVFNGYSDRPPQVEESGSGTPTSAAPAPAGVPLPPPAPRSSPPAGGVRLKRGARNLLDAVVAVPGATRAQARTMARITSRGGTFTTYLGHLRAAGYVEERGGGLYPTAAGKAASSAEPLPTDPDAIIDHWRGHLKKGARDMLDVVVRRGAAGITRDELRERAGIAEEGGTFSTYLGHLRARGLIEERDRRVFLVEHLRRSA